MSTPYINVAAFWKLIILSRSEIKRNSRRLFSRQFRLWHSLTLRALRPREWPRLRLTCHSPAPASGFLLWTLIPHAAWSADITPMKTSSRSLAPAYGLSLQQLPSSSPYRWRSPSDVRHLAGIVGVVVVVHGHFTRQWQPPSVASPRPIALRSSVVQMDSRPSSGATMIAARHPQLATTNTA